MRASRWTLAVVLAGLWLAPATQAECCMGPPVWVYLPINTPLTSTLHPIVVTDDPDHPGTGSVHAYLNVGQRRVADLGSVDTTATTVPHEITFRVPSDVIGRARKLAHRNGKPWLRGVVKFVVRSRYADSGVPARTYGNDGFVSLAPAVRTSRPIRIGLGADTVDGAVRERLTGSLFLRVPKSWPRTSPRASAPTTFGLLHVGGCTVNAYAWTIGVATRDPARYVAEAGGPGETVYAGKAGTHRWRVKVSPATDELPSAAAIGIVRIGRHRYAGLRMDIVFSPRCGPAAARDHDLLAALRRGVRDLVVRGRVTK
jgi:hypothetical protein